MNNEQQTYPEILKEKLAPEQEHGSYGILRQLEMNEIRAQLDNQTVAAAVSAAVSELARAESLYPEWPADPVHAVAIMAEEAGEAVRAANNLKWGHGGGTPAVATRKLKKELVQTAAMCLRVLKNMPEGVGA